MTRSVEVNDVLTLNDFKKVQAMAAEKPRWRRVVAFIWYAYIGVQTAASTYYAATGAGGRVVAAVLWLAVLVTVAVRFGLPRLLLRSFTRRFPEGMPVHLELSEAGIRHPLDGDVRSTPWERISRWRQRDGVVVLYVKRASSLIVPTRALSVSEANELDELLGRSLGSAT